MEQSGGILAERFAFCQTMTLEDFRGIAESLRASKGTFETLGPAPAPMTRVRGEHRVQIFLKGTTRRAMRQAVQSALAADPGLLRRVTIDVDPLSML